jgi:hypothetical protein
MIIIAGGALVGGDDRCVPAQGPRATGRMRSKKPGPRDHYVILA